MSESEYDFFLSNHRRDIACLADADRSVRKAALARLETACSAALSRGFLPVFFSELLHVPLTRLFSDPNDRIRESAVDLASVIISSESGALNQTSANLISAITLRIKQGSEQVEELRVKFGTLLSNLLIRLNSPYSSEVIDATTKLIGDPCPEVKKSGTDLVILMTQKTTIRSESLVHALAYCLKHQHWRVRLGCLHALESLIAGPVPEEALIAVSFLTEDRQPQLREALARCYSTWLQQSGWKGEKAVLDDQTGGYVVVDTAIDSHSSVSEAAALFPSGSRSLWSSKPLNWEQRCLFGLLCLTGVEEDTVASHARDCLAGVIQVLHQGVDHESVGLQARLVDIISPAISKGSLIQTRLLQLFTTLPTLLPFLSHSTRLHALFRQSLKSKKPLITLSLIPLGAEWLSEIISLSCESEFMSLSAHLVASSGLADLALPIFRGQVNAFAAGGNWASVDSCLEGFLGGLLEATTSGTASVSRDPALASTCVLDLLSELVDRAPRKGITKGVESVARVLLSGHLQGTDRDRLMSILLTTESPSLLADNLTDKFFESEMQARSGIRAVHAVSLLLRFSPLSVVERQLPMALKVLSSVESIEGRADALEVCHEVIGRLSSSTTLLKQILDCVVLPNLAWKPGNANSKIRKAGLVCFHDIVTAGNSNQPEIASEILSNSLPVLRSCLDDSWVPDNRYIGVLILKGLLELVQGSAVPVRDIYPELLKRLDDSQDPIRVVAAKGIGILCRQEISRSTLEYIARALLVHLDDASGTVSGAVADAVLLAVSQKTGDLWLQEVKAAEARATRVRRYGELAGAIEGVLGGVI